MTPPEGLEATTARTPRELIEERITERAVRRTAEQVQETCSFARAERILGREYHGRFLIELLQNAADAWRLTRPGNARTTVRIVLTDAPALLVANRGTSFPASAVVESLGHIGRSTKSAGEAIGHKGIGFKSVRELTLHPELYSGLANPEPTLAVRFDPAAALELIRAHSPEWDELVAQVDDIDDPLDAVPVLRYPVWVDQVPDDVAELAEAGFDTIIRLPFDQTGGSDPARTQDAWMATVRDSFTHLTDEMLLLLGMFERIDIDDRPAGESICIEPGWGSKVGVGDESTTRELVTVRRNDSDSSTWQLYRRTFDTKGDLSADISVGVRTDVASGQVVNALPDSPSAPFHLFFPTRIGSGLPFLLHGYFEVDAARTGFYEGSARQNEAILSALEELVELAVADLAARNPTALTSLADLLGVVGVPENAHARRFQLGALARLDTVEWVPVELASDGVRLARPIDLLVDEDRGLVDQIVSAFSPDYVHRSTGWRIPSREIGGAGHRYLESRQPERDIWEGLEALLRPGVEGPWDAGAEDDGFKALLDLVAALQLSDRQRAGALLSGVRGDEDACLLPVLSPGGGRVMLPVPDLKESVARRRGRLVMARARDTGDVELIPPPFLDVAFLPAGLLENEAQIDRARPLGVREFTVDNVLNRLRASPGSDDDRETVLRFLWALLAGARTGEFSTRSATERASEFNPAAFFWCRPGEGGRGGGEADRQRRRHVLTETMLPSRAGPWRPASSLAFSEAWADWLESGACGQRTAAQATRAACYRALSAVAPDDSSLLADPEVIVGLLDDAARSAEEDGLSDTANAERHAFLLMLGVWEVFPVDAFESWDMLDRPREPFGGAFAEERKARIGAPSGWTFGQHQWSGDGHRNVWIAEDFRFLWSLELSAGRDAFATAQLLSAGAGLYDGLKRVAAFCPGCSSGSGRHRARHQTTAADLYPSILTMELRQVPWVPAVLNGEQLEGPVSASSVWWSEKPPSGAGLRQSPLRYLPLCAPTARVSSAIRSLAQISQVETASRPRIEALLEDLQTRFDAGRLPIEPASSSSAKQAFIGLHRLAYERLDDLTPEDDDGPQAILERVGVLCELADTLVYSAPGDTRHDDGRFVAYRRYFDSHVPFSVLPRDRGAVASRLGLPAFSVELIRRDAAHTRDVTEDVSDLVGDRGPELLAILVHHSLGTQTLEPASQAFEDRARRLRNLRIFQVDDLVIDAHVDGTEFSATIGQGTGEDLFLESATGAQPALYHDLRGDTWRETFRRKLPMHLAVLLGNPAYAATFALFLLAETDSEREEVLRDLGIANDDVDGIRASVGAVSDEQKAHELRWFSAILKVLARDDLAPTLQDSDVAVVLEAAGLPATVASHLAEHGGGDEVRRDASADGILWLLEAHGLALSELDAALRSADPLDGLNINVAQSRLAGWIKKNRRHVAAVLAERRERAAGKALPDGWRAPDELRFLLDPQPAQWLSPVLDALRADGFDPQIEDLASRPIDELMRLVGLADRSAFDALVASLYDHEEQARILRGAASAWRKELGFIAVMTRTRRGESRSAVRAQLEAIDKTLPAAPAKPSELRPVLPTLFRDHATLAEWIHEQLADRLGAVPDRTTLVDRAAAAGIDIGHRREVERALDAPTSDATRKLRATMAKLKGNDIRPTVPLGLEAKKKKDPDRGDAQRKPKVSKVKVGAGADARKRRAGDEGERWALGSVLAELIGLSPVQRGQAIDEIAALLSLFEGAPVNKALTHVESASDPHLDEEELIEELTALLHLSPLSDGFGFDMLGWLVLDPGAGPVAVCLEVKSTRSGTFHLSRNEWARASWFHERGDGDRYVVLVVHRTSANDPPARIDILADPVDLVATGRLRKVDDGYELSYRVTGSKPSSGDTGANA